MPISQPFDSLTAPAVATINHLLAQEAWARDSLARHSGKVAVVDAGTLALRLRVARDGMFERAGADDPAAVTIRLRLSDLPLIAHDRERAFSYVRIEGDAEFANTISQLSKGLRWEAEHDLERVVGPVAAVRIAGGARAVADSLQTSGRRAAENLAEFLLEERPVLVRHAQVEEFGARVSQLRDDVERSAKRLARLEQKLAPRAQPTAPASPAGQHTVDLE